MLALSNRIWVKMSLLMAGGVGLDGPQRSLPTQTVPWFTHPEAGEKEESSTAMEVKLNTLIH